MPNHVRNIIEFEGDQEAIANLLNAIKGDENRPHIDFNKIIPMPLELVGTSSPATIMTQEKYDKFMTSDDYKRHKELGMGRPLTQAMSNELIAKYGTNNWYDWSVEHWGTKWNAYDQSGDDESIMFQTAWSHPYKLIEEMSTHYPEITFNVKYADEDLGSNCGMYTMVNGELEDCAIFTESCYESMEFADDVWGNMDSTILEDRLNELDETFTIADFEDDKVDEWPLYVIKAYFDSCQETTDFSSLNQDALLNLTAYAHYAGEVDKEIALNVQLNKIQAT